MHKHLRYHAGEEVSEQTQCEPEASPIVPVLHNFQSIALEVDSTIKVHFVKGFHWDLALAMVFGSVLLAMEVKVVLNRTTRIFSFLGFSG